MRGLTSQEINNNLLQHNSKFADGYEFISYDTSSFFKCLICSEIRKTSYRSIINGHKCLCERNKTRWNTASAKNYLFENGFILIGKYTNADTMLSIECAVCHGRLRCYIYRVPNKCYHCKKLLEKARILLLKTFSNKIKKEIAEVRHLKSIENEKRDCEKYRNEHYEEIWMTRLLNRAYKRSKILNLDFDLTREYLLSLEADVCPYFNFPLKINRFAVGFDTKSLDRIDNNIGYVKGNVEFISQKANTLKNDSSILEQKSLIYFLDNFNYNKDRKVINYDNIFEVYDLNLLLKYFQNKKYSSTQRKIPLKLSFEDFLSILPLNGKCPVLDVALTVGKNLDINSLTIDRIDNSLPYIISNIAVMCRRANKLKNNATLEEIKIIYNRRIELERIKNANNNNY